jgi:hypothetical protein
LVRTVSRLSCARRGASRGPAMPDSC